MTANLQLHRCPQCATVSIYATCPQCGTAGQPMTDAEARGWVDGAATDLRTATLRARTSLGDGSGWRDA